MVKVHPGIGGADVSAGIDGVGTLSCLVLLM